MFSKICYLLFFISILVLVPVAHTQEISSKGKKSGVLVTSYKWYNGEGEHTIWLNPALVAEFGLPPKSKSVVKQAYSSAIAERGSRGLTRIWRLNYIDHKQALKQARTIDATGTYSPVFSDRAIDGARKRALPGGVIVYFKPDWSESQVTAWAASQELSIASKLEIGPNIYLLKTASGIAALETANRIHLSGDVVSAEPNWWVEVRTR